MLELDKYSQRFQYNSKYHLLSLSTVSHLAGTVVRYFINYCRFLTRQMCIPCCGTFCILNILNYELPLYYRVPSRLLTAQQCNWLEKGIEMDVQIKHNFVYLHQMSVKQTWTGGTMAGEMVGFSIGSEVFASEQTPRDDWLGKLQGSSSQKRSNYMRNRLIRACKRKRRREKRSDEQVIEQLPKCKRDYKLSTTFISKQSFRREAIYEYLKAKVTHYF